MKIQNINLSRTRQQKSRTKRRKSTKTRHISTSFTLLNLLNLSLNSLKLKDRKVWKLYRDDTTTTATVYINRQTEYEKLIPIWKEESFLQISTLTLLQIIWYMTRTTLSVKFYSRKHLHISSKFNFKNDHFRWRSNSTFGIIHQTSNRQQVIDEYNEEFLVDATIISLKARGTIQSHLEETRARMVFYTYIREYKQQQFYKFMQDQQQTPPSTQ